MPSRKVRNDVFTNRTTVLTVFLLVCFTVLVSRLFYLQVVRGAAARARAEDQHSIYQKLFPSRGEIKIVDRLSGDAADVATDIKSYLVYAVPQEIVNPADAAAKLSPVIAMDSKDVLVKLTNTEKKYVPIKKQLTDEQQQKIKDLNLPGIYFDSEDTRFYPEKNLLSQVLGFVGYNKDSKKVGLYGLERAFESQLAGTPGLLEEEKDTNGAWIFGSKRSFVPARDGDNLILTVDKTIQFKAQQVLKDSVVAHGADSGCVIVANPKTGAILAMAGYPDFDPNEYNKATDPKVFNNECTTGNYEPGSTFKSVTMAAAVDAGKVTPDTTYNDTGVVEEVDGTKIQNSDHKAHGIRTMTQVLEESLNTGAIFSKNQIGNPEFYKAIQRFGFGRKTGIEVAETSGNLDNLRANIAVNYDTASFGQGFMVTPIQMLQAYGALANEGKMMKPYIVQSRITPEGKTYATQPEVVGQVISAKTANILSAMLVSVVENGHGKKAGVSGYYIGGKTGTAQVSKDGRYVTDDNIGSFIGYGPIDDPQFVMLVRIDHPRDVSFAESTAAPAWGELAQFILSYYHIAPTRPVEKK